MCHYHLDQYLEAIAASEMCLGMEPDNAQALANKAIFLLDMGKARAGLESARATLSISQDIGPLWARLGYYFLDHAQARRASDAFRRAIALTPGIASQLVRYYGKMVPIEHVAQSGIDDAPMSLDELLQP